MKRILSFILVVVTMIVACSSLVACGGPKPKLDLDKAKKNLKKNDYDVEICDGDEWDDPIYGCLAIDEVLYAEDDGDNWIVIYKCKTAKDAELMYKGEYEDDSNAWLKYEKYVLKQFGKYMDKEDKRYLKNKLDEYVSGYSGKYFWCGTKDAVEDTKG